MIGITVAVIGISFLNEIVFSLDASPVRAPLCIEYARIIFGFAPAFFLQMAFQTFFVTAGKPTSGLVITRLAGVTNIVLDYVFMAPMGKGMNCWCSYLSFHGIFLFSGNFSHIFLGIWNCIK